MGVSNNEREPYSKLKGRARQGGLGLGRFGAWKIGKKVTLVTRSSGQPVYMLQIDFSKYPPECQFKMLKVRSKLIKRILRIISDGNTGTYTDREIQPNSLNGKRSSKNSQTNPHLTQSV